MAGCPTTAFTTPFVEMVANFLNLSLLLLLGAGVRDVHVA